MGTRPPLGDECILRLLPESLRQSRWNVHHRDMRSFNTSGPMVEQDHYCIPPLERMDLDSVLGLIHRQQYFVLHAPRQSGKTSTLIALQNHLNSGAEGDYRCLRVNVEVAQACGENIPRVMAAILDVLAESARSVLGDDSLKAIVREVLADGSAEVALVDALQRWALSDSRPLVLLIDEINTLVGDALVSVLRQLRSGFDERPDAFPQSVVLCSVGEVRDYRIRSDATGEPVAGGSPFNICAASLRLGDFDLVQVEALLGQHTAATGQQFEPAAVKRVHAQTAGQPWLVNALCEQACFKEQAGRDRSRAITEDDILAAQEVLIQARVWHLRRFGDKLLEKSAQRVIEPLLCGAAQHYYTTRDLEYVRELGLVALDQPPRIANPIYAEFIPRELTFVTQFSLLQQAAWYVNAAGSLDSGKLLEAFQEHFREHSEHWLQHFQYQEAGPQLLLQAFLQRVLKGSGHIEREYGLARQRVDLLLLWQHPHGMQRTAVECKVMRDSLEQTLEKGLSQTADFMHRRSADAGHLVIFDRSAKRWKEKVFRRREELDGTPIEVWGM